MVTTRMDIEAGIEGALEGAAFIAGDPHCVAALQGGALNLIIDRKNFY